MRQYILVSLIIAVLMPAMNGCVRRRMTIRTNPPGATVYLDNEEFGKTPISRNFEHYGRRKVTLVREGYETKTVYIDVNAPFYQWPGLDFVSEVLIPGEIKDDHYFDFDMNPVQHVSDVELIARASELRAKSQTNGALRINGGAPLPANESFAIGVPPAP